MKHVIYISGKPKLVLLHIRRLNSFKVSNKVKEYKNKIKTQTKNFQLCNNFLKLLPIYTHNKF